MKNVVQVNEVTTFQVPGDRWKHGLCSCYNAGLCPCLMGWCCVPILLGQVVECLNYAARGNGTSWLVCWIFASVTMIVIIIEIIILVTIQTTTYITTDDYFDYNSSNSNNNIYAFAPLYYQFFVVVIGVWAWFIFIVSCCTRMQMRKQYHIEPICCGDNCCDDCCILW